MNRRTDKEPRGLVVLASGKVVITDAASGLCGNTRVHDPARHSDLEREAATSAA